MLKDKLRRKALQVRAKAFGRRGAAFSGSHHGYLEHLEDQHLVGWVVSKNPGETIPVGLFVPEGLITAVFADIERPDVYEAGFGNGRCGFAFPIVDEVLQVIAQNGGKVSVRVLNDTDFNIGSYQFPPSFFDEAGYSAKDGKSLLKPAKTPVPLSDPKLESCRASLFVDLQILANLLQDVPADLPAPEPYEPTHHVLHDKLFENVTASALVGDTAKPAHEFPAYIDYMKYRSREDRNFDLQERPADFDHYLEWYLLRYGGHRRDLRVPLSKKIIDYLNDPFVLGGQPYTLTRIMWWQVAKAHARLHTANMANHAWHMETVYWWAWVEAKSLFVEDCMVTQDHVETLRAVPEMYSGDAFPISEFMLRFHRDNIRFHFLDLADPENRKLFFLSLIALSARRPDILRYLPQETLENALEGDEGAPSHFQQFLAELKSATFDGPVNYARFVTALRKAGFDLPSDTFTTITPNGDRLYAQSLPSITGETVADVQIIGPIKKASGLGQATRLSAAALERTGLVTNAVDFGLDNPAAEGYNQVGELTTNKKSKINLIHLNAESIPLCFAYDADNYNGSYNIGYFFWELDTPAYCHYLGMGLLDEIWVSSEYVKSIYEPDAGIPVTNVGMCFEDPKSKDRRTARDYVNAQLSYSDAEFVFFLAFDSFSFTQRKNPVSVLQAFQKAFKGVKDVRIVVKSQNRDHIVDPPQIVLWEQIDAMVADDPRIHVMDKTLSYEDLIKLKKGSDCYVSLHRSEGWGFGMIEAMNLKVPVVCTGYSGNMDFCNKDTAWLVEYKEVKLTRDDYLFVRKDQKWAEPSIKDAARQMRAVYDDPKARREKVEYAYEYVQRNFSEKAIGKRYGARLDEILKSLD